MISSLAPSIPIFSLLFSACLLSFLMLLSASLHSLTRKSFTLTVWKITVKLCYFLLEYNIFSTSGIRSIVIPTIWSLHAQVTEPESTISMGKQFRTAVNVSAIDLTVVAIVHLFVVIRTRAKLTWLALVSRLYMCFSWNTVKYHSNTFACFVAEWTLGIDVGPILKALITETVPTAQNVFSLRHVFLHTNTTFCLIIFMTLGLRLSFCLLMVWLNFIFLALLLKILCQILQILGLGCLVFLSELSFGFEPLRRLLAFFNLLFLMLLWFHIAAYFSSG